MRADIYITATAFGALGVLANAIIKHIKEIRHSGFAECLF